MPSLTIELLQREAGKFSKKETTYESLDLFGVSDGKAIGTYLERKFQEYLGVKYNFEEGNSAKGIDFPSLQVDMKVTKITQPQSSCPFKSARQKIFGLGYSLLVFVYDKHDNQEKQTGRLEILHTIFVESHRTADFQMTKGIREIIDTDGNVDDIMAFMADRLLPVDEIGAEILAEEILKDPPQLGYLTISNALQWRLQYRRAIELAGDSEGVIRIT